MAKKSTPNKPTIKKATVKKEAVKPRIRISGPSMVRFVSNGLSRYMNKPGKIHNVTADHGQLLVDKGYGVIVQEDIDRVSAENA